jgi:large subunit ribosomal protein L18
MSNSNRKQKYKARKNRHRRVRARVQGTAERPRLNVFRSNENIFAQLIDDDKGHTLASASTIDTDVRDEAADKSKVDAAHLVGKVLGERAKDAGIDTVVFDRGGYQYHGRVAALADGAREAGLKF